MDQHKTAIPDPAALDQDQYGKMAQSAGIGAGSGAALGEVPRCIAHDQRVLGLRAQLRERSPLEAEGKLLVLLQVALLVPLGALLQQ